MNLAKYNTAKTFLVGPILDADGVAKTDEVVASIKVTKNGSVGAAHGSSTLTHNHTGHYLYAANAGDIDTYGEVEFSLNSTTNAMAPVKFQVVTANTYDTFCSTDMLNVNVETIKDATVAASSTVTFANGTVSTLTQTQVSGGAYDITNASCVVNADLKKVLATTLTESAGAGKLGAAFIKLFNVTTPVLTCESVNQDQDNPTTAEIKAALEADGSTLYELLQRSCGKVVIDRDNNTIKYYKANGSDLIATLTMATLGNVDTITRS